MSVFEIMPPLATAGAIRKKVFQYGQKHLCNSDSNHQQVDYLAICGYKGTLLSQ